MYMSSLIRNFRWTGLYTLDPISPVNCGPFQFVTGYHGCKEAPTDLDLNAVKQQAAVWLNFYQNEDGWLHSGAMKPAQNFRLIYGEDPDRERSLHAMLDEDSRVWAKVNPSILNTIRASMLKALGRH